MIQLSRITKSKNYKNEMQFCFLKYPLLFTDHIFINLLERLSHENMTSQGKQSFYFPP